jgi:transposase
VRKHGVFCPFLKSSPEERAWALVEIAQRFPRRGGARSRRPWRRQRPGPSKPGSPHGSGLGVFRWVVERTLAWLHRFRRLALRYERRADVHEAFLTLGCALITWRYLKREF